MFLKILQNLQENPCTRVSLLIKLQLKKRPWHRCWFFKNSFFYWTPLLAASGKIRTKSLKLEKFQLQLFLTLLGIMIFALHCDIIVVKRDIHIKIFVVMSIYIANQTKRFTWHKNSLQWYTCKHRSFYAFTEWVVLWNCSLNDLSKIVWQIDVWQ